MSTLASLYVITWLAFLLSTEERTRTVLGAINCLSGLALAVWILV